MHPGYAFSRAAGRWQAEYCARMSQEDVEVVRRTLAAFNENGVEATLEYFDPEVEWVGPPEWLEKHLYEGHEGIREIAAVWTESFDDYHLVPVEFVDAGDDVVALVFQRGHVKGSSDPIEQQIGYVWTVRNGKGVRVRVFFSWDQAREVAGVAT